MAQTNARPEQDVAGASIEMCIRDRLKLYLLFLVRRKCIKFCLCDGVITQHGLQIGIIILVKFIFVWLDVYKRQASDEATDAATDAATDEATDETADAADKALSLIHI